MSVVIGNPDRVEGLSIICDACPARAEIVHQGFIEAIDSLWVVVRCHDELTIRIVTGRTIGRLQSLAKKVLLLEDLAVVSSDEIRRFIAERDALVAATLVNADMYRRVLAAAEPTEMNPAMASALAVLNSGTLSATECIEIAEAFMGRAADLRRDA